MILPTKVAEDKDDRVASYWMPGQGLLLQTSSYARFEGEPISAQDRLQARTARESLSNLAIEKVSIPDCPDHAAVAGTDQEGCRWVYCYAVWSDLTILITISGTPQELEDNASWAFKALRSLRRT